MKNCVDIYGGDWGGGLCEDFDFLWSDVGIPTWYDHKLWYIEYCIVLHCIGGEPYFMVPLKDEGRRYQVKGLSMIGYEYNGSIWQGDINNNILSPMYYTITRYDGDEGIGLW